jgi:hypothetical protein
LLPLAAVNSGYQIRGLDRCPTRIRELAAQIGRNRDSWGLQTVSDGEQWLSGIAAALRSARETSNPQLSRGPSAMSNTIKTISNDQLVTATGGAYIRGGGGYAASHPLYGGLGLGGFGGLGGIAAANAANNAANNNNMMMCMAMAMANRPH